MPISLYPSLAMHPFYTPAHQQNVSWFLLQMLDLESFQCSWKSWTRRANASTDRVWCPGTVRLLTCASSSIASCHRCQSRNASRCGCRPAALRCVPPIPWSISLSPMATSSISVIWARRLAGGPSSWRSMPDLWSSISCSTYFQAISMGIRWTARPSLRHLRLWSSKFDMLLENISHWIPNNLTTSECNRCTFYFIYLSGVTSALFFSTNFFIFEIIHEILKVL